MNCVLARLLRRLYSLALTIVLAATGFAAAPDSIAGKILEVGPLVTSVRAMIYSLSLMREDGSYSYLLWKSGSVIPSPAFPLDPPNDTYSDLFLGYRQPADGVFRYTRTGESSAELRQTDSDGLVTTLHLEFSTAASGTIAMSSQFAGLFGPSSTRRDFSLTDPTDHRSLPLINTALRGNVGAGRSLIAGLVIPGTASRNLLIRAVGPGLTQLGVPGVWQDPDFQLYRGEDRIRKPGLHFSNWTEGAFQNEFQLPAATAAFETIFNYVGAFPLAVGSKDAAEIVRLEPGAYTIVAAASAGDPGGEVLIEVYLLP
jgi:hypothetical protein